MNFIFVIISNIYSCIVSILFFNVLYQKKEINTFFKGFVIVSLVILKSTAHLAGIPILNAGFSFLSTILLFLLFYKRKSLYFLINCAILTVILVSADVISTLILTIPLNMTITQLISDNRFFIYVARYVFYWLTVTLMYIIFFSISKKHTPSLLKAQEVIFYIILTCLEIFLLQYVSKIVSDTSDGAEILIMIFTYLFIDIYTAYLIYKISKGRETENELRLVRQQSNMQLSVYKEISDKYKTTRAIVHDMKKHITALEGLIDCSYTDKAQKYTELLHTELDKLVPEFIHNNQILAVIINDNLTHAQRQDIKMDLDIEEVNLDFVSDIDITSIFANIVDNAVEACSELEKEKRKIKIAVKQIGGFLVINISNPYTVIKTDSNGKICSTKEFHEGIGLSNVKTAVEKYDGAFEIDTENNYFVVKITVPIPQKITKKPAVSGVMT